MTEKSQAERQRDVDDVKMKVARLNNRLSSLRANYPELIITLGTVERSTPRGDINLIELSIATKL